MADPVMGKTVAVISPCRRPTSGGDAGRHARRQGFLRGLSDEPRSRWRLLHLRLYAEIREKRGLAYGASSYLASYDHAAILGIATATRADAAPQTVDIIRKEIERMATTGPTQEELDKAKAYVKGSYAVRNLDSSLAVAQTLVGIQLDDLGKDYIDKRQALIDAVSLDDVKAAAKKLLDAQPTVVTVGPAGA